MGTVCQCQAVPNLNVCRNTLASTVSIHFLKRLFKQVFAVTSKVFADGGPSVKVPKAGAGMRFPLR